MKLLQPIVGALLVTSLLFSFGCGSNNNSSDKMNDKNSEDSTTVISAEKPASSADTLTPAYCCIKLDIEKMNSIYRGISHNIFIAASAEAAVSCSNGELLHGDKAGKFSILAKEGEESTITVKENNGCEQTFNLRLKKIPDPVIYFGTIKGSGQMTKAELFSQNGIFARMENFDFDIRFRVVSFVLTMNINGVYVEKKSEGSVITPDMKSMLAGARPGSKVLIEQVKVQGPDSLIRSISGVIITVR
ncbi:MAG: GldM family protein [Chitinophagaceae bacterium]|jgi:hypothetical protein